MRHLLLLPALALASCGGGTANDTAAPEGPAVPAGGGFSIDGVAMPVTIEGTTDTRRRDGRRDVAATFSTDLSVQQLQDRLVAPLRAKGATVVASTDGLVGRTRDGRAFGVRVSAERDGLRYGNARIVEHR